ncbi:MAG TPA: hypothetical protein VF629_00655 [Hymenobacter sp.]|jgi:hypothetical protein|uniref:hypothetical protein n=1 Tax=Hymenobacter sp. TaxID=1898978 RepID=UPI002ED9E818
MTNGANFAESQQRKEMPNQTTHRYFSGQQNRKTVASGLLVVIVFVMLSHSTCFAQNHRFPLSISPSVRVRSTIMNFFNFKPIRYNIYIPYDYERNFQTISIGPKVSLGRDLAVSYTPLVRYGYAYTVLERQTAGVYFDIIEKKGFILDQQFWLTKQLHHRTPRWYKPVELAAGWGIVNTGARFYINNGPVNQFVRVETNTADVAVSFGSANQKWKYTFAPSTYTGALPIIE